MPFERDSSRPTYSATLHYNDQRGASALAGRDWGTYTASAAVGLGSALTLSLRGEYGSTLSAYRGGGRTVAIGEHGQRYIIVVQNLVLLYAVIFVAVNILVDISYAWLDPRIRFG